MFFVLYSKNIYYGSEKTILASDGFHQYAIFAQNLRNILHGTDSLFYTFTSGLGLNFYALISYYLGSFLSPFVYFFDLKSLPDAIYIFTLIKFGLIGLSTYFALHKIYPSVKRFFLLTLSFSFALMSFLTSQLEINNWLDVFILVPLIILGLHQLVNKQKVITYYITLTLLFIQNYYFGYMLAIFLILYTFVLLVNIGTWKRRVKTFSRFVFISLLSALTSAVMLLPTYLDLSTHGEQLTKITKLITPYSWYLDLPSKLLIGTYDTTQFNAIPMLYVGLFPFLLATLYFTNKSIKFTEKIAYLLLILFLISSYYLQPLDLFWQGMHAPNMFLHRYFWTFPLLITLLAGKSCENFKNVSLKNIMISFAALALLLASPFLFSNHYEFLTKGLFFLSIAFLTAYTILFISIKQSEIPLLFAIIFTLLFTVLETSVNTFYQISGIESEWVFPTRSGYNKNLEDIKLLVDKTKKKNNQFYRMERIQSQTGNDSMKYNYNGISQFSSIRNRSSSKVLDRLGFKSDGTNLNLRYQNNTLIMDSLMAVNYNLSDNTINKYGFTEVDKSGNVHLFKNKNSTSLAILSQKPFVSSQFTVNTLDNQTKLLNNLSNQNLIYFTEQSSQLISEAKLLNNKVSNTIKPGENVNTIEYSLSVLPHQQVYVSVPNISFSKDQDKKVLIAIDGNTKEYTIDNSFSFFDLGYFQEGRTLKVDFIFPHNQMISFEQPHFYGLDTDNYQKAMDVINSETVTVHQEKNKLTIDFDAKKDSSLLITLPFDKGWSAELNGKKVKINKAQKGFMKVDVAAGKGQLKLLFIPYGFKTGLTLSVIGIIVFSSYVILSKIKTLKKKQLD